MQKWRVYSKKADFDAIGSRFNIDPVTARIIRNRDVTDMENVDMYLNGTLDRLHDPMMMKDMDKAVSVIASSIRDNKHIRIIGDYDIDGICSIYILFKGLKICGADVDYEVPDRITDGYGINENLIKQAYEAGVEVIITCDNGIAAASQIDYANELGMTVVITDHHDVPYEETDNGRRYIIPKAAAVVDPKQNDCRYPFKMLCGAGIAYKFIDCMVKEFQTGDSVMPELLQFAAIATVGDIVDLLDENRIIVKEGLKLIANTGNYGLNALMAVTGVSRESINAYHIGFVLGPCLNASGRLDSAKRALKMLVTDDRAEAERHAGELKDLNEERKKLTSEAVDKAVDMVENSSLKDDRVLVIFLPDCHESIAGIVAGRIREKYYKPVIVLTRGEQEAKGSARSIESYNMFEKLSECKDLFTRFGGHPMAAGLSLPEENIPEFRRRINEHCNLSEEDLTETVWIDVPMPLEYINEKLILELDGLEPFGKANPKPVFADKNISIRNIRAIGKDKQYTRMTIAKDSGMVIDAVGFFPCTELETVYNKNGRISCTYYPEINEFRDKKQIQVCVTGYRIDRI
ncbi:single-stranded-DNA-specific exonuclease RecJ [Butyrivibrio sp. CAG:318]|jgi:single-stranded-DNA-specific exonuclease|nr:single-stranded-DNA-specific exonuclease RecJ [Butyrivibrio sp. CAG:318]